MTKEHMKRCSTSHPLGKYLTHIKLLKSKTKNEKKQTNKTNTKEDVGKLKSLHIISGNVKWYSHWENKIRDSSQN